MLTLFFYVATLGLHALGRWLRGRWAWGVFLGGAAFGLYNEVCFEFCWDYSPVLGPMIWRDVPLVVILGWGSTVSLATAGADLLVRRLPRLARWQLLFDVLFFSAVGVTNELLMHAFGYWNYNFPIQGTLWMQLLGYVSIGLLTSSLGRRFDSQLAAPTSTISERGST